MHQLSRTQLHILDQMCITDAANRKKAIRKGLMDKTEIQLTMRRIEVMELLSLTLHRIIISNAKRINITHN